MAAGSQQSAIIKAESNKPGEAKLIIETSISQEQSDLGHKAGERAATSNQQPATSNQQPVTSNQQPATSNQQPATSNQQPATSNQQQQTNQQAAYVQKLKEGKNSAAQSFELAVLRIKDENTFEAITANNIEQKFIEQERNKLFLFLQQELQNRLLQFSVVIEENTALKPKIEPSLSSTQQFQKMIQQYPLVKELKDRLGLELDY